MNILRTLPSTSRDEKTTYTENDFYQLKESKCNGIAHDVWQQESLDESNWFGIILMT